MRKWMSVVLTPVLFLTMLPAAIPQTMARTDISWERFEEIIGTHSIDRNIPTYGKYLEDRPDTRPRAAVVIGASDYTRYEEEINGEVAEAEPEFEQDAILTKEAGLVEFSFTVPSSGLYDIKLLYYPVVEFEGRDGRIEGKNSPIQRSIFINGELPYRELALVEFNRVWQNRKAAAATEAAPEGTVAAWSWDKDARGNDLRPSMVETPEWIEEYVYDSVGYVGEPLSVYLTAGIENTITLYSQREPMLLKSITLHNREAVPSYADALGKWTSAGAADYTGRTLAVGAEFAARTSSQMLYPMQDQSSPAVGPASAKHLLNNSIGGISWRMSGQWIEWDFVAPVNGLYNITMHTRQNFKRGAYVSRRITIDGEVPFAEMESYQFNYTRNWKTERLEDSNGNPYKFYLEAGVRTIRMEAVLGEYSEIISEVRDVVYDLNAIYRKVISRTGVTPDRHTDYRIREVLPELNGEMVAARDKLSDALVELERVAGSKGRTSERERVLVTMRDQLDFLIKDNERFPRVVSSFRVNIRACGTWLNDAMEQPLQVDMLYFHPENAPIKMEKSSAFHKIAYEFSRLFYSFVIDYNQVGDTGEGSEDNTIVLWVGSGRDQAKIVKGLIDEWFTSAHNINVTVMLVDMTTLLQASLAGQGPDVAIQVGGELPMNFGLRGSVADLRKFPGFDEVRERFVNRDADGNFIGDSAMTPYEYGGKTYALPETQIFPMMFYRKDILAELGVDLPDTWDDVAVVMSELAFNRMEFGMLPSEQVFTTLLYQHGGNYYNENATRSALDSEEAIAAFRHYTEFYTDYKLDRATSELERFRTGEAPIIIADYTLYNILQVSALELRGIWGMAPVPGRRVPDSCLGNECPEDACRRDGSCLIDRSASSNGGGAMQAFSVFAGIGGSGGACVMMESSDKQPQVWEFMKWWTSADTQIRFAREMESLMGPAARVPTANREAFDKLPWAVADYRTLSYQYNYVRGIPQVPGGYFTYRNINNAFYAVTTPPSDRPAGRRQMSTPREALMDRVILINDEIRNKRTEFKLPLD